MYQRPLTPDELMHFGVKGMHWGVRRYQNPDGTLTPEGKRRMGDVNYDESTKSARATKRSLNYLSKQKAKMDANAKSADFKRNRVMERGQNGYYAKMGREYLNRSKEIDNMMKKTMSAAKTKGQTPYVDKQVTRFMSTGKQKAFKFLTTYMFGIPGFVMTDIAQKSMSPERYQTRNKYKVR